MANGEESRNPQQQFCTSEGNVQLLSVKNNTKTIIYKTKISKFLA